MPDLRSVQAQRSRLNLWSLIKNTLQNINSGGNNKIKAKLGINKQILTYLLLKDHNFAALPND